MDHRHQYDLIYLNGTRSGLGPLARAHLVRLQAERLDLTWDGASVDHVARLREDYLEARGRLLAAVNMLDVAALHLGAGDPPAVRDALLAAARDAAQMMLSARGRGGSSPWRVVPEEELMAGTGGEGDA